MTQSQQQQTKLLGQGLLVAPWDQRLGNVSDQKITAGNLFRHREAPRCRIVTGRHYESLEGSLSLWWEPSESGQDIAEGYGQNLVVDERSDTGKTHHVGPVLKGFLREILPCINSKENGRTIYPATTAKPISRWICCRILETQQVCTLHGNRRKETSWQISVRAEDGHSIVFIPQ